MFKELGMLTQLMGKLPKIKEEMENLQVRLGQITAEGEAGGVRVCVNGRMEVVVCELSEDALKTGDRETLQNLIKEGVNQAIARVRQQAAEETSKMAAGLGLPPGLGLPGMP